MISDKQYQLLIDIYNKQYIKCDNVLDLVQIILGKPYIVVSDMTHYDFSIILKTTDYYTHITHSQKMFLQNYTMVPITTRYEYNEIIKTLSKTMYIPKYINFNNLEYIIKKETNDYIIGSQIHKNSNKILEIISFKNLLIIDYDDLELFQVKRLLFKFGKNETWRIYKTFNGHHAYCTSKMYNYTDLGTAQFLFELQCDPLYIEFTKHVGFATRLCKKPSRIKETFIEQYICTVGSSENELQELVDLLLFKDSLI